MIKPTLEYAWSSCTQKNIDLLEAVQRQSARFVFNNYSSYTSVSEMLRKLDFKTLSDRRNESRLILLCKIIIGIDTPDILFPKRSLHSTRGHLLRLLPPFTRINCYHNSFFFPQSEDGALFQNLWLVQQV